MRREVDRGRGPWFIRPVGVPPLSEPFEAHSYVVDAFGLLSAPALSGWLQEAAGRHAEVLGVGMADLQARGLTWVLARQAVAVDRPISMGETAVVVTWPSGADRLSALRDFEVRVGDEVRARAVTQWIVVDLESRKPVRPGSVLPLDLVDEMEHVLPLPGGRPALPEPPEVERPFATRYRDIDRNLHVTNATYVEWACEAVPEATWAALRLATFEAYFIAECRHGSRVLSRSSCVGEGSFVHSVVRSEDGKELARLRTTWVDR